jgi:2-C-methyl-D-erythritol 4-phosphate cytidylyltransferase
MVEGLAAILPVPNEDADAALVPLAGQSPLVRIARTMCGDAVVAVAATHVARAREDLAAHRLSTIGVVAVQGQARRAQCLTAALEAFTERPAHVLIYDVRRPLASVSLRDKVIDALRAGDSTVMPMLAVTDSVKTVDAEGTVTGTLDRAALRAVQYPRGFTVSRLSRLLAERSCDDFDEVDESLRAGVPIREVDGDADAFVVELPRDADYVAAVIECRGW